MQLIINADDCGRTAEVDSAIEQCIIAGRITSTTIMANMDDFENAIKLYRKYKEQISFGCHLNVTEGEPILYNQELLDFGYYTSSDNHLLFNGNEYRNKLLPSRIRKGIYEELCAQIEKLLDSGVEITHLDSHHHIHTSPSLLTTFPQIVSKYGIQRVRRVRNFVPRTINRLPRNLWPYLWQRNLHSPLIFTDYFADVFDFVNRETYGINTQNKVIELMCHPGGTNPKECELFETMHIDKDIKLINYGDI